MDGEADLPPLVAVLVGRGGDLAAGVEVHARAEELVGRVGGGEDDGLDAGVRGELVEGGDEGGGHFLGEGVAGGGTVKLEDDDGGDGRGGGWVVGELEGGEGEGVVAGGEVGGGHFGDEVLWMDGVDV